ncbi:MAG TPA: anti-sigma factor [Chitinophagaceae bacterium]|nr:anti-sigma factor [Chitinophagaceae bacterium]
MNIQEYISSGIIESYVMGLASNEEKAEFEQLCAQYPELKEARNNFELALEEQAKRNAISPPEGIKNRIWSAIQQGSVSNTPKIISMESTSTRRSSSLRWVAAASIILFLGAGYFAYNLYNKNKDLKSSNKDLEAQVNKMSEEQKVTHDPNATVVNLVGLKGSPSSANVYWDSTSANVYLIVKNMPLLPGDKQYQLWALIDNKPVDLGLFDPQNNDKVILKMKNTQKADAFAITIENRGNTGGPTLEQLQSMGKAKL